jgi:hypothetical protein
MPGQADKWKERRNAILASRVLPPTENPGRAVCNPTCGLEVVVRLMNGESVVTGRAGYAARSGR